MVLWRQKEQFSDGVGYSWINQLKRIAEERVTDLQMEHAHFRFPINPPPTKEAYYYRSIFNQFYPKESAIKSVPFESSVACSTEKALEWDETFKKSADPSGRAVATVHHDGYDQ